MVFLGGVFLFVLFYICFEVKTKNRIIFPDFGFLCENVVHSLMIHFLVLN